jgi:flagellar biosynthesis protein FlhB
MFSLTKLTELIKSFIKIGLLLTFFYYIIKESIPALALVPFWGISGSLKLLFSMMKIIIIVTIILFAILALIDFMIQSQLFLQKNKMTKEEAKRDRKDEEGDPQVKGRRKNVK